MPKYQKHTYIYPHDDSLPGHIKMSLSEATLCGIDEQSIKDMSKGRIRKLKRYIEDRAICHECETAFRGILASMSNLVDEWS